MMRKTTLVIMTIAVKMTKKIKCEMMRKTTLVIMTIAVKMTKKSKM